MRKDKKGDIMFGKIKRTFEDMDKVLLLLMIFLSIFGLFNIVSASSREAVVAMDQSVYYYFYRHLIILIGGYIAFFIITHVETKHYYKLIPILFVGIISLNIFVILKGTFTRGASNWIDLGFFKLQPSEIAKPILIAALALAIERSWKRLRNPKVDHKKLIILICTIGLILPAIVFAQKDLGTALIQGSIFGVVYLLSPIVPKEKWKIAGGVVAIIAFALLTVYAVTGRVLSEKQMERFNYFDPCSKYAGTGYQVCNAYIAINLGGLNGVGIGKSTQKYSYIPEAHTDMVFAIFAEEYGYIAGVGLLILYAIILYRILMLSSRASTIRGKYMCLGVATYIFAHIFINLGGMFGIIPLTGVPLPFLSYGGSFTLSLVAALGIVQRVHIETKRYKIKF